MTFKIELTGWEVEGIKNYLKEVSPDIDPQISKEDIRQFLNDLIQGNLNSERESVNQYIKEACNGK